MKSKAELKRGSLGLSQWTLLKEHGEVGEVSITLNGVSVGVWLCFKRNPTLPSA